MSVKVMEAVFEHSQSAGAARLVLLALADEASSTGEVSAYRRSMSWLVTKCNSSLSTVHRAIENLVALGELEVVRRGDGRTSSDYLIRIEGCQVDTPGVSDRQGRGVNLTPPSSRSSRSSPLDTSTGVDETFEKFWKAYPRKTAKKASERAFKAAVKRGDLEKVRAGLKAHLPYWTAVAGVSNQQYIPHASTWLNGERYNDVMFVLPTAKSAPKRGVRRFERDDGTPYWVDGDENIYEEDPNA